MTVSKNVVIFALIGLAAVSVDLLLDRHFSHSQIECQQLNAQGSSLALTNMAALANHHTISGSLQHSMTTQQDNTVTQSTHLKGGSQCNNSSEHSVSWMDWVFSWQDSPTFHYLDLLELLTSHNDDNSHGHPSPVKS